jgi:hypothetical protein
LVYGALLGYNCFMDERVTYFAQTDSRGKRVKFGIKPSDRTRHVYMIGKTGMGKSTLLENMAAQDIQNGNGMCFIDPHGSAIETLLEYVPEDRVKDVVYFAPFDTENPISFNIMEDVGGDNRHLVAQGLLSSFKKIWGEETFSDRMEHIINNTLLALLEYPGATMLSINRIFVDKAYRKKVVENITDPSVKAFWEQEYAGWDDRYRRDAYAAVLNKIGQFTSNPIIRNIVGQEKSSMDFRKIMDEKKILLVNLSKGQIGEANANLLGSMLTTKVYLAAMSRANLDKTSLKNAPNFYLFIDEFQNLANDSFADILAEARKYNLNLTIAHQYIEQMPEKVRHAVFGNVGTMITFRVGATDAEVFEKEFSPIFTMDDLVNLGKFQIYLKLMIDGVGSSPFSAATLPPVATPEISFVEEVIESSRELYTKPRSVVEKEIGEWLAEGSKNIRDEQLAVSRGDQKTGWKPNQKAFGKKNTKQKNKPNSYQESKKVMEQDMREQMRNESGSDDMKSAFSGISLSSKKEDDKKPNQEKSKPQNNTREFKNPKKSKEKDDLKNLIDSFMG